VIPVLSARSPPPPPFRADDQGVRSYLILEIATLHPKLSVDLLLRPPTGMCLVPALSYNGPRPPQLLEGLVFFLHSHCCAFDPMLTAMSPLDPPVFFSNPCHRSTSEVSSPAPNY